MNADAERTFHEITKVYEVIGEEMVEGRSALILKLRFEPEEVDSDYYRFRLDKEMRYLIDYRIIKQALLPEEHVNDFAPKDSVFGGMAGGDDYLLNFVVFPQPNVDEAHVILQPRTKTINGYKQKITFTPAGATVIGTTINDDGGTDSFVEQTWKPGDKWPERAVRWQPSEAGVVRDVIVETLIR